MSKDPSIGAQVDALVSNETVMPERGKVTVHVDDSVRAESLEVSKVCDPLTSSIDSLIQSVTAKVQAVAADIVTSSLTEWSEFNVTNKTFFDFAAKVTKDFTSKVSTSKDAVPNKLTAEGVALEFGLDSLTNLNLSFPNKLGALRSCVSTYRSLQGKLLRTEKEQNKLRDRYESSVAPEARLAYTFEMFVAHYKSNKAK